MLTWQDFENDAKHGLVGDFIARLIGQHTTGEVYKTALAADLYDRQRNVTVNNYTKFMAEHAGNPLVSTSAANSRIASNFFHRLNVQRCAYSLGNGVIFSDDSIKDRLGSRFDNDFYELAYKSLIHGESYGFWNNDRLYVFPVTEFAPIYDEMTGALRAGVRFWRIAADKPMKAVLYEEDGYTLYMSNDGKANSGFYMAEDKRPYIVTGVRTEADGFTATGAGNYSTLPVIRMQGSKLNQSTLVGLQAQIDSYDLIQSGFANDLQDCAQIYWIIENCGGMSEDDLRGFLNKLTRDHVAVADTQGMGADASSLKPYVQNVPFESRVAWLTHIRAAMYEGFGALDVTSVSSSDKTATEIEAAYEPLDENADDFEFQCIECVMAIMRLMGINAVPTFKRNRINNVKEQVETIMLEANYLDDETVLNLLPNISTDDVEGIMARKYAESQSRYATGTPNNLSGDE